MIIESHHKSAAILAAPSVGAVLLQNGLGVALLTLGAGMLLSWFLSK